MSIVGLGPADVSFPVVAAVAKEITIAGSMRYANTYVTTDVTGLLEFECILFSEYTFIPRHLSQITYFCVISI